MDIITLRLFPVIRRFPDFRFQKPYYFVDQQFRAAAGGFRLVDRAADFGTDCFIDVLIYLLCFYNFLLERIDRNCVNQL